jgi:hypothetical protein
VLELCHPAVPLGGDQQLRLGALGQIPDEFGVAAMSLGRLSADREFGS